MPVPILIIRPDFPSFTVEDVNNFFCEFTRQERQEIAGKSIREIMPMPGENGFSEESSLSLTLRKVMETQKPATTPVIKYILGKGKAKRRFLQWKIVPSFDENGQIKFLLSTATDVTERLRADIELRKTWQRTIVGQQFAKAGYWENNLIRNKLFWSNEVYSILGVNKDKSHPCYELFYNLIHPDDRPEFILQRTEAILGEKKMNIQIRIIRPDGTVKWVHYAGYLVKNNKGQKISFQGIIKDITEMKSLELSLAESNNRYQHLSKATFDTVYEYDLIHEKFLWTEGYLDNFGYGTEELNTPRFWLRHIHPEEAGTARRKLTMAIYSDTDSFCNEYRLQKSDGNYANVIERCIFIRDTNGKAVRMIGAIQDITEKKNLEKLLSKANQLARIGSWEINFKTNSVYWSDMAKEIHNVPADFRPTLQNCKSFFKDPSAKGLVSQRIREGIRHGTSWQDDIQIVTFKGMSKWVRIIGEPGIINGRCARIVGSFQDIDEIKKTESEVRRLLEEKNELLESIGEAFIRIERDCTVSYWNKVAEDELHIPRNKVINKNLWKIFPIGLNSLVHRKFQEAFNTSARVDFEQYFHLFEKWLHVSIYPSDKGLSIFFRDITQQKSAQIKLQESEERYSELFRLNPLPIWIFDIKTFQFVQVNQATVEMYGYSEEELLNMSVLDLRPPEERLVLKKALQEHGTGDGFISDRFTHWTKSKEIKRVEIQSKLITIKGKQYRLAIVNDITERERTEQAITRAIIKTQENERFEIGAELHDNVCQILASTYVRMGVVLPSVNENGRTVFRQCRDYINLATQEIRNLSHRLAPAAIHNTTLKESLEELINTINIEQKYNISLFIDDTLDESEIGKELQLNLYRILQEQLRNIVKYSGCTHVEIGIIKYKNKITMYVADNGVGFDPDKVTSGIGLSNMKRRAELFEGKFEIISTPGHGCELNITIPLDNREKISKEKDSPAAIIHSKTEMEK